MTPRWPQHIAVDVASRLGAFDIDARFQADDGVTVLFGPSGAGKTTILNMIAGVIRPDRGRIVCGDDVLVDTAAGIYVPTHKRRIGYVYQDSQLFPHLTVGQNLKFGAWFARGENEALPFDTVVDTLGITELLGRRPTRLSGGEKHRVALGRALLARPRLLLMDEPLASLDGARKEEILPLIERVRDEFGVPIFYVTHAVDEARRLASTAVMISGGRVTASGRAPDEAEGRRATRASAVPSPSRPSPAICRQSLTRSSCSNARRKPLPRSSIPISCRSTSSASTRASCSSSCATCRAGRSKT